MQVNGKNVNDIAREERMHVRKTAEAFGRLSKHSDWPMLLSYFEQRANGLMAQLMAPSAGADGMSIALSSERIKGALNEIQLFPQYVAAIMKQDAQNRSSERDPGDEAAPKTPPPGSEADFVSPQVAKGE